MIHIVIQLILYGGLYLAVKLLLIAHVWSAKKMAQFLFASKQILKQDQLTKIFNIMERQLKRCTGSAAIVCWYDETSPITDWKRRYYRFALLENIASDHARMKKITLKGYIGTEEHFLYYPVNDKGKTLGAILLQFEAHKDLHPSYLFYLKYFSSLLVHRNREIERFQDFAKSIELTVRRKIAQDMHDGLAQKLFFLSAHLFRLRRELAVDTSDDLQLSFDQLEERIRETHREVRAYIDYLYSRKREVPILDAIKLLVKSIEKTSQITAKLHVNGYVIEEEGELEEVVYHFIEEAATNAVKHAEATMLNIYIDVTQIQWTIRITDDGLGMAKNQLGQQKGRMGIVGMKERIKSVGGFISIGAGAGKGTEIIAVIPRERRGVYGTG